MKTPNYIEIHSPAPVLNTPDFSFAFGGESGSEIPLNAKGHPHCFEFVALTGMVFSVHEAIGSKGRPIYRVSCLWYPNQDLFIDGRFTQPTSMDPNADRPLPPRKEILQRMLEMKGTPYVWGGNWRAGIPEMLRYYPPKSSIDDHTSIYWTLSGVDCSGLLFEATRGATPRNTSQLIRFGRPIPIGSPISQLDMIVYPGHVVFVLDERTTIESKFPFGVIQRDFATRIAEIETDREQVAEWTADLDPHKHYVIRRFI